MKYVFYHDRCIDGFTAAWVFRMHAFQTGTKTTLIAIDHGPGEYEKSMDLVKETYGGLMPGDSIVFGDYAPTVEQAVALTKRVPVTILDHHKSALADWGAKVVERVTPIFDMERSGARLAWDYCFPGVSAPPIVQYVEDRDLWRFKLNKSKEINEWINSFEMRYENWDYMHSRFMKGLGYDEGIAAGEAILRSKQRVIDDIVEKSAEMKFAGLNALVANYGVRHGISEAGHALAKKSKDGIGVIWSVRGAYVEISIRGDGRPDVSEIAKQYNGGGHHDAAGFKISTGRFFANYVGSEGLLPTCDYCRAKNRVADVQSEDEG